MAKRLSANGVEYFIDKKDIGIIQGHVWYAHKTKYTSYLITNIGNTTVRMHRLILGLTNPKVMADHKNKNGLDNRRSNIRAASSSQNRSNSSYKNKTTYRGVSLMQKDKPGNYRASIFCHGKQINSHRSKDKAELARWYDKMAIKIHGEFATLNFPEEHK